MLWPVAVIVTYFANDAFAAHAFQGLSFPLAILIVRGGQRLRLPVVIGGLAVAALSLPGLAFNARKMVRTAEGSHVQYVLPGPDARALAWVNAHRPPGGVLAPTPFASVVPYRTGKAVWVGHGYWSRDYPARARRVDRLFAGHMKPAAARAFVTSTGARILISDCAHPVSLTRTLGPLIATSYRFGCARVYLLVARRSIQRADRRSAIPTRSRRSHTPCCRPARSPGRASGPGHHRGRWPRPRPAWARPTTVRRRAPARRPGPATEARAPPAAWRTRRSRQTGPAGACGCVRPRGASRAPRRSPRAQPSSATRAPAPIPSLRGSGVPE